MPKHSDDIQVDVADLKSEIRAIEQSVEAAKARFDESVRRANDAVEQLEKEVSSTSHGTSGAPGGNDLVDDEKGVIGRTPVGEVAVEVADVPVHRADRPDVRSDLRRLKIGFHFISPLRSCLSAAIITI